VLVDICREVGTAALFVDSNEVAGGRSSLFEKDQEVLRSDINELAGSGKLLDETLLDLQAAAKKRAKDLSEKDFP
jgi:hypothetical protein